MLRSIVGLWLGVMIALNAHAVNVSGWAGLSGQTDHAGTRVLFQADSPSARTDSTFTAADGHFSLTGQPGVYDVEFAHAGFVTYRVPNQVLLFDTQMDSVTLTAYGISLSGELSGTLAPGVYSVIDTISVAAGSELNIEAGARLTFFGRYPFIVRGTLRAIGTATDSVVFAKLQDQSLVGWAGIWFYYAEGQNHLDHCVIVDVYAGRWTPYPITGGAVVCDSSDLVIEHTSIQHCTASLGGVYYYGGAGVSIIQSHPLISNCLFENNTVWNGYGGAIGCNYRGFAVVSDCVFRRNKAMNYSGGAIYCDPSSSPTITRCAFEGNRADDVGSIYCTGPADISECFFVMDSTIYGEIAGVLLTHPGAALRNSVFTQNYGTAVGCSRGNVERCTFYYNRSLSYNYGSELAISGQGAVISSCVIVPYDNATPVSLRGSDSSRVQYCDVISENAPRFKFYSDDPRNGPPGIGVVALTNANGDSCDTYYNLFLDPQFVDTASGDYHLRGTSPCIDAGDPSLPHDPDGTVADMGAFYFDQLATPERDRTAVRGYELLQNYPNPFNAMTRIAFTLPRAGEARLEVFDVLGRHVTTLASGPLREGSHEIRFDAGNLASGMYVYRLQAGSFVQAKKMTLIR